MKKTQTAHILTLIVDNEFGVLTRITAQIRREGWNIKSLAVAECVDPAISRITLTLICFDTKLPTALYKLSRLACVREATAFDESVQISRELMLMSVKAPASIEKIDEICVSCKLVGEQNGVKHYELTGLSQELDLVAKSMQGVEGVALVRTGPIVTGA